MKGSPDKGDKKELRNKTFPRPKLGSSEYNGHKLSFGEMIAMGKTIHYVAIGDSLTVGYGAEPGYGFVSHFKKRIEDGLHISVTLTNAGVNGATTSDILEVLETDPELRTAVAHAELITITAGGNDLLQAALPYFYDKNPDYLKSALQSYESNYSRLIAQIKAIKAEANQGNDKYVLALIGLYNPIPLVPDAAYWLQRFNLFLKKLEKTQQISVVPLYDAFQGKESTLLYNDHIHPNAQGYELIEEQLASTIPVCNLADFLA
jgi:lysophospholipase L1-like esterase